MPILLLYIMLHFVFGFITQIGKLKRSEPYRDFGYWWKRILLRPYYIWKK